MKVYQILGVLFFALASLRSTVALGFEQPGSFSFLQQEYRVREGEKIDIPINREFIANSPEARVFIKIVGVSATPGDDFVRGGITSNPLDFNINARWPAGEFGDDITGDRYKAITIQTKLDALAGEGDEVIQVQLIDTTGGSLGSIITTNIVIEDTTGFQSCTRPELSRFMTDASQSDFGGGVERNVLDFRNEGFFLDSDLLVGEFPAYSDLLVEGNACVNQVRYTLEGDTQERVADIEFVLNDNHYFVIARGADNAGYFNLIDTPDELLAGDFISGGGRRCSGWKKFCHQRFVTAKPISLSGETGQNLVEELLAYQSGESDSTGCTVDAGKYYNLEEDDITDELIDSNYTRGRGAALEARPIGSVSSREPIISGGRRTFRVMDRVAVSTNLPRVFAYSNREVVVRPGEFPSGQVPIPKEQEMGFRILSLPRAGALYANGEKVVDGDWYKTDANGNIEYVAYSANTKQNDKFEYEIAAPDPVQFYGAKKRGDNPNITLYDKCLNSKATGYVRVTPAVIEPPTTEINQRPEIESITQSPVFVQVGGTQSIVINAKDDGGATNLNYQLVGSPPTGVSITGSGSRFTVRGLSVTAAFNQSFRVTDSGGKSDDATVTISVVATTPPVVADNCVYPGGDTSKWGWDNVARKSCKPVASTTTPPTTTNPVTSTPVADSCVYPGGDTSKWGWDNVARKSCKPVASTTTPPTTTNPVTSTPVADNCVYPGGDTSKWGWDNVARKSCKPVASTTTPPTTTNPVTSTPVADNCVYPGGDTSKWGWDNVARKSCSPV